MIQKLSNFVSAYRGHEIRSGHIVLISDECHHSRFGSMHVAITGAFTNCRFFSFTGAPILAENVGSGDVHLRITEQALGEQLRSYMILSAIGDNNVLSFRTDYVDTFHRNGAIADQQVPGIDTVAVYRGPRRISRIVSYILEHFGQKTKRHTVYSMDERRLGGFNSILTTESIAAARDCYVEFTRQQEVLSADRRLSIGIIYSYAFNAEAPGDSLREEGVDPNTLSADDRAFLDNAIDSYNRVSGTNHDISTYDSEGYYEAIAKSLATHEIDLVIVVNISLMGFDSKTLSTLWVGKNLRVHGPIQAFSKTNRIPNVVKSYDDTVCFRGPKEGVDEVIALSDNKDGRGSPLIRPYSGYLGEYIVAVEEIRAYLQDRLILSEEGQKAFTTLFSESLRLKNTLTSFDRFAEDDPMGPREFDGYKGTYVDLYSEFRPTVSGEETSINDDLVFGIELVKQVQANVGYVIRLVEEHKTLYGDAKGKEILAEVSCTVNAGPSLYSKRGLIETFFKPFILDEDSGTRWEVILEAAKRAGIGETISAGHLRANTTKNFVIRALECGYLPADGTEILKILPPISRSTKPGGGESRAEKKAYVIAKPKVYLERFLGV